MNCLEQAFTKIYVNLFLELNTNILLTVFINNNTET